MEPDLTCDVCIIGGNIAGSYLAYLLAKHNIHVVVVEQNRIPGIPSHCAGIVSQRFRNIVEVDPTIILNRVDTAYLISENNKKVEVSIQDHPYILDRIRLDQYFYHKAESCGVMYLLKEKFFEFQKNKDFIRITTQKRTITAKMIVGCDGPNSRVARLHGIRHNLLPAMQVRVPFTHPKNSVRMYFKRNWKYLFGWVIPEGNGICRIGLGCETNLLCSFQSFLKELRVDTSQILEKHGGQIIIGYPGQIAFNRAILLGDAAGMVKATTGGGINTLLKAADYAKNAILNAMNKNNFTQRYLVAHYQHSYGVCQLKYNIFLHYLIRIVLVNLTQQEYEEGFAFLKQSMIKKVLLKYGDMDFPLKFLIKILLSKNLRMDLLRLISLFVWKLPRIFHYLLLGRKYDLTMA